MRSRQSDSILLFPLLPIFLVGMFPDADDGLLGFAGLGLLGILLICAALTDALDANNDFNQHIVVEGYARRYRTRDLRVGFAFGHAFRDRHRHRRHRVDRREHCRPAAG